MKRILTISIILFCFACNKQQVQQPVRIGGLLKDNPAKVAKIPLLMSKGFISAISNENDAIWLPIK